MSTERSAEAASRTSCRKPITFPRHGKNAFALADQKPIQVEAVTFIRWMGHSYSAPVQLKCDDSYSYIVKSPSDGLATPTEQIVARLAGVIGAPVPEVRLVHVSQELIDQNPGTMDKYTPGLCHGLRFVANCTGRLNVVHQDLDVNRGRFYRLAVLYGWFHVATDHQFFYDTGTNEVWSFDHGLFFPSGPHWSAASLDGNTVTDLDQVICGACNFNEAEKRSARSALNGVTETHVASAVMSPPMDWPITHEMRRKAAEYLMTRCLAIRA